MTKKRNICLFISIILLITSLMLSLRINFFMRESTYDDVPAKKQNIINPRISENKYKYCDIIKIASKYGIKIKKVFYKDNIWDIDGVMNGSLNDVRGYINLLDHQDVMYYVRSISGNDNSINLELEIKIK